MFSSVHLEPHHPIIERGFSAFAMSLFVEYQPRRQGRPHVEMVPGTKNRFQVSCAPFPLGVISTTYCTLFQGIPSIERMKDVKISGNRDLGEYIQYSA